MSNLISYPGRKKMDLNKFASCEIANMLQKYEN